MTGPAAELLALAIDPDTPSEMLTMRPTGKIKFEGLRRGKRSTWAQELVFVFSVLKQLQKERPLPKGYGTHPPNVRDAAIAEACDECGLERTRGYEIWHQYNNPTKPRRAEIRRNKRLKQSSGK